MQIEGGGLGEYHPGSPGATDGVSEPTRDIHIPSAAFWVDMSTPRTSIEAPETHLAGARGTIDEDGVRCSALGSGEATHLESRNCQIPDDCAGNLFMVLNAPVYS